MTEKRPTKEQVKSCPKCRGTGYDYQEFMAEDWLKKHTCPKCKGTGKVVIHGDR